MDCLEWWGSRRPPQFATLERKRVLREMGESNYKSNTNLPALPSKCVAPPAVYAQAFEKYKMSVALKVVVILFFYVLCIASYFAADNVLRSLLMLLGVIGIMVQALTLPTGVVQDKHGNRLDLNSGEIYLKK